MSEFNGRGFGIPSKENYTSANDIINKLEQILKNQSSLAHEIEKVNHRLDRIEKNIGMNASAPSGELAIPEEISKKNEPAPSGELAIPEEISKKNEPAPPQTETFPIKSDIEMTAVEQNIRSDFQKYVNIIKSIITPGGITENFAKIVDSPIILSYDYDGTKNKKPFKEFKFLNMAIFEAVKDEIFNENEYRQKIMNCFRVHRATLFCKQRMRPVRIS